MFIAVRKLIVKIEGQQLAGSNIWWQYISLELQWIQAARAGSMPCMTLATVQTADFITDLLSEQAVRQGNVKALLDLPSDHRAHFDLLLQVLRLSTFQHVNVCSQCP
eukprot:s2179_g10.t1